MIKTSIRQLSYVMLITLTFLSFGTYVLLENFKAKTENVSTDVSEENAESGKETSKELTDSYLFEKAISLPNVYIFSIKPFPALKINVSSFSVKPSTPPPDLFEL